MHLTARKTTPKRLKKRLPDTSPKPNGLVEFFARSPLAKEKLEFERELDYGRDVTLDSVPPDVER